MVNFGDQEESTRSLGSGLNVPFEVRLVDPRPRANLSSIGSDATKEMEESAKLALYSDRTPGKCAGLWALGSAPKAGKNRHLRLAWATESH